MTLNRKYAPEINSVQEISFQKPELNLLDNGINVFSYNDSQYELIRIDFVFKAGTKYHSNSKLPVIVNKLILEGTKSKSNEDISTIIDFCGAFLNSEVTTEHAQISLSVLHKHLTIMLPLVAEIIEEASFPESELSLFLSQKQQEIAINSQKVSFVARDKFPSLLYGENHLYGRPTDIQDYLSVSQEMLVKFHKDFYKSNMLEIYVSGSVPTGFYETLNNLFGKKEIHLNDELHVSSFQSNPEKKQRIEFTDAVQNAVRIGRIWPNRQNDDYVGSQVLLTLFGGYFGSRLMSNIREEKGYTYGIGAGVKHYKESTYMFIGTEVKSENYLDVIDEIYKEMSILQKEIVSTDELNLVKSVMQGAIQRSFDGTFSKIDRFKELKISGFDEMYYMDYLKKLKSINANDINIFANKYFKLEDYFELVVGNFNLNK